MAMAKPPKKEPETYSDEETAKRRDEVVRRMLNTPPKHKNAEKPKPEDTKRAVELVRWIDSFGLSAGWQSATDDRRLRTHRISSVGRTLRETDEYVVLAGNWGEADDAQVGGVIAIPKCAIQERLRLRRSYFFSGLSRACVNAEPAMLSVSA